MKKSRRGLATGWLRVCEFTACTFEPRILIVLVGRGGVGRQGTGVWVGVEEWVGGLVDFEGERGGCEGLSDGEDFVGGLVVRGFRKKYRLSLKNDMPPQDKKPLDKKEITMAEPNEYISVTRKNFLADDNKGRMYDELIDGKLKEEALMHKARFEESWGMQLPKNYEANNTGKTQDNKKEHHDLSICNIRRFEMMKYLFDADDEYVAIKEREHSDHSRTNVDECQAYREFFALWMRDGS
ncbi:hypothetical protein Tco_0344847 [Tanacetum coccineum]